MVYKRYQKLSRDKILFHDFFEKVFWGDFGSFQMFNDRLALFVRKSPLE
ncbi:hypothetical protein C943_03375 [Mariniradius saccharolyticus AK6]|uniref:Uncharacterized protein n=1 Tax=Mariniradius saccharolyticus AK6 TaxID=1239962 RepID=M7XJF0_9BACT|nr:hypothetical protein C943_03375 [Mariniradius saccharolyticus AK6]